MCKGNYNSVLKGCGGQHGMRAYEVGIKDADWSVGTVFAPTAGKAKYKRLLDLKDAGWEPEFKDLTCRSLGDIPVPPTLTEVAQREADAFNARHPIGTMLRYWSWVKEGDPTGTAAIRHHATVVCEGAVIWMQGVSSCHSLSHVEAVGVNTE